MLLDDDGLSDGTEEDEDEDAGGSGTLDADGASEEGFSNKTILCSSELSGNDSDEDFSKETLSLEDASVREGFFPLLHAAKRTDTQKRITTAHNRPGCLKSCIFIRVSPCCNQMIDNGKVDFIRTLLFFFNGIGFLCFCQ